MNSVFSCFVLFVFLVVCSSIPVPRSDPEDLSRDTPKTKDVHLASPAHITSGEWYCKIVKPWSNEKTSQCQLYQIALVDLCPVWPATCVDLRTFCAASNVVASVLSLRYVWTRWSTILRGQFPGKTQSLIQRYLALLNLKSNLPILEPNAPRFSNPGGSFDYCDNASNLSLRLRAGDFYGLIRVKPKSIVL